MGSLRFIVVCNFLILFWLGKILKCLNYLFLMSFRVTALSSSVLTGIFIVSSDMFNYDNRILAWNTLILSLSFLTNVVLI
jgi:hypothetical protein